MKFTCPKCNTRYTLPEDKIPPAKTLRFTCKKCGNVMRLKQPEDPAPSCGSAAPAPKPTSPVIETRIASVGQLAALRTASALPAGPGRSDPHETRVASVSEIRRLQAESARASRPAAVEPVWHALISGEQRGPLHTDEVEALLMRHEVDKRTYVWREGMSDWQRLGTLPEFEHLAEAAGDAAWRVVKPLSDELAPTQPPSALGPQLSGAPVEGTPAGSAYLNAPPGEMTRMFMATAGLYRRRRRARIALVTSIAATAGLITLIVLDLLGALRLPGMGRFYDATGLSDPNVGRAIERVESKLSSLDLNPTERVRLEGLRAKLTSAKDPAARAKTARSQPEAGTTTQGIVDTHTLDDKQKALAQDVFADARKQEGNVLLADPQEIQAPNLPEGLTQEAIAKVVTDNSRSMQLCLIESSKKGEQLQGKMDIQLTIDATGSVTDVVIATAKFKTSAMAACTGRRIRGWKFPRFNGEPVTVGYPYILQTGGAL